MTSTFRATLLPCFCAALLAFTTLSSHAAELRTASVCKELLGENAIRNQAARYNPEKYRNDIFWLDDVFWIPETGRSSLERTIAKSAEAACAQAEYVSYTPPQCNPQQTQRAGVLDETFAPNVARIEVPEYGIKDIEVCQIQFRRTLTGCDGSTFVDVQQGHYYFQSCTEAIPHAKLIFYGSNRKTLRKGETAPFTVTAALLDVDGGGLTDMKNKSMQISLSSSGGEDPGRLSATELRTGFQRLDSGYASVTYYPPSHWDKKQVVTLRLSCPDCGPPQYYPSNFPNSGYVGRWDTAQITLDGPDDIVIGFFNGVANTRKAAQASLERLETEFGPQYKDTPLEYDWFYNQTACQDGILGKIPCLDDVAEVFEARTGELNGIFANRWEVFWDILAGRHRQSSSWSGRLIGLLGDGGNALLQGMDATANAAFNRLATMFFDVLTLFTNSPTYANQAEHLNKLQQYADEGARFVMVAHSQGNLFVNTAFDGLKATRPEARAQVVHVAPASPTLRGDYVLADIDIVINGLRTTGLNSVPRANISLPVDISADFSGHSFEPTYLDKARAAYARTVGMINSSLDALTP